MNNLVENQAENRYNIILRNETYRGGLCIKLQSVMMTSLLSRI